MESLWSIETRSGSEVREPLVVRTARRKIVKIGRAPTADICINEPGVSNLHACLELSQNRVILRDMFASTGTWVNGERVDQIELSENDVVQIGSTLLRVSRGTQRPTPTHPPTVHPGLPSPQMPPAPMMAPVAAPTSGTQGFAAPPPTPAPVTAAPTLQIAAPIAAAPAVPAPVPTPPAAAPTPRPTSAVTQPGLPWAATAAPTPAAGSNLAHAADPIAPASDPPGVTSPWESGTGSMHVAVGPPAPDEAFSEFPEPTLDISGTGDGERYNTKWLVSNLRRQRARQRMMVLIAGAGLVAFLVIPMVWLATRPDPTPPQVTRPAPPPKPEVPVNDETYVYHRLPEATSITALAQTWFGERFPVGALARHNPSADDSAGQLPAGTVVKVPRAVEYEVARGDTLGAIADKLLGDSQRWEDVYTQNRAVLPSPSALDVGMKLKVQVVDTDLEARLAPAEKETADTPLPAPSKSNLAP